VLTGGTGLTRRDVTPEAVRPLFEKEIAGFGELFRMLSHREIGSAAMLSRACAGTARGKAIFALPGSPAAVRLAMNELIVRELGHLVEQLSR
jgi:molybdenum cofactor biosynthesis protein B